MEAYSKPLVTLSVDEFVQLLDDRLKAAGSMNNNAQEPAEQKNLIYGIRGIERLFGVSHKTAQHYKDTFLQPAVSQTGRVIVVDRDLALKLFAKNHKSGDEQ